MGGMVKSDELGVDALTDLEGKCPPDLEGKCPPLSLKSVNQGHRLTEVLGPDLPALLIILPSSFSLASFYKWHIHISKWISKEKKMLPMPKLNTHILCHFADHLRI